MPLENNSDLRRLLQEIIDMAVKRGMSIDQLEKEILGFAATHSHTIQRLQQDEAKGYRCFVYAFELVDSLAYGAIAAADEALGWNIFCAGSEFARFLIEDGALEEIKKSEIQPDDVVIYLDSKYTPQHAGKIVSQEGRIKSKWGGTKLFLEHGLWELPDSYGNTRRFSRRIAAAQAERAFLKFIRSEPRFKEFINRSRAGGLDLRDLFDV